MAIKKAFVNELEDGRVQLVVVDETDTELFVPPDPLNRHYIEAKAWFDKQKKKPFKWPKPLVDK